MALVSYVCTSSSSDECEDVGRPYAKKADSPVAKKPKLIMETTTKILPAALTLLGERQPAKTVPTHCDDRTQHEGRVRAFKHERGNWATYIHIAVNAELLEDVQELCQSALADAIPDLHAVDDLHISLSRTVVLQYHHIESFSKSLERALLTCGSFNISLNKLHIYRNEERTRTFVALKIDDMYFEKMHQLMSKVDTVMLEYKLPRFYEEPSFHISFLWCLGDKVEQLNKHLGLLKNALNVAYSDAEILTLFVHEVKCKSGNKEFNFKLK